VKFPLRSSPLFFNGTQRAVVDDEAGIRESFTVILRSFGAEVHAAGSARETLELLDKIKPDLLICDIAMPEEDGYTLLNKIRQRSPQAGGNIPAIALSAYAGQADVHRSLAAGFLAHVAKPTEAATLAKAISEVFDS